MPSQTSAYDMSSNKVPDPLHANKPSFTADTNTDLRRLQSGHTTDPSPQSYLLNSQLIDSKQIQSLIPVTPSSTPGTPASIHSVVSHPASLQQVTQSLPSLCPTLRSSTADIALALVAILLPTSLQVHQPEKIQAPNIPASKGLNDNLKAQTYHPNAKNTTTVNTNGTTTTKLNTASPICKNCKTQTTPLWRRDESGQVLCNACGLFLKLHGRPRPISLKTDTIKSRIRVKQPLPHLLNSQASSSNSSPQPLCSKSALPDSKPRKDQKLLPNLNRSVHADVSLSNQNIDANQLSLRTHASTPLLSTANRPLGTVGMQPSISLGLYSGAHLQPQVPSHLTSHHVVQPLHYPNSTPTQFAPGLQKITSPLLLLAVSNTRLDRAFNVGNCRDILNHPEAMSAAGALETMSHELGPSATFKHGPKFEEKIVSPGVSLMHRDALKNSHERKPVFSTLISHPTPPKLPALGKSLLIRNSPAFSPHFSSDLLSLPTLLEKYGNVPEAVSNSFPDRLELHAQIPSDSKSQREQPMNFMRPNDLSMPNRDGSGGLGSLDGNYSNNSHGGPGDTGGLETTLLKTRISELEIVNDLYRTRIMELEAMEQAARLREGSMRKRLNEVLRLSGLYAVPNDAFNASDATHSTQRGVPFHNEGTDIGQSDDQGQTRGKRNLGIDSGGGDLKRTK